MKHGYLTNNNERNINKDYLLLMQEWSLIGLKKVEKVEPGQYNLNPFTMEFNMLEFSIYHTYAG